MILGDDNWYTAELDEVTNIVDGAAPARPLLRSGVGRGVALWWRTRRSGVVAINLAGSAARTLVALERIAGHRRRYLILMEFIPVLEEGTLAHWGERSALRRLARSLYYRHVLRPVVRRALLLAHCLTQWEAERNVAAFGLPPERFRFIPWFGGSQGDAAPASTPRGDGVLASGRAACDWETVFAAAAGERWPLTVVCSRSDLAEVRRLNRDRRATVLSEIPVQQHAALLRSAAVYLIALRQADVSSGQVRLTHAADAGTAVVASATKGLTDYLTDGDDALVFAPGDHQAARAAVSRLLADPSLREHLVAGARRRGQAWGRQDYLEAVREMILAGAREAAQV